MKLNETNLPEFLSKLHNQVEMIGYAQVAERTELSERSIRRMFQSNSMPTLKSIVDVSQAIGFGVEIKKAG